MVGRTHPSEKTGWRECDIVVAGVPRLGLKLIDISQSYFPVTLSIKQQSTLTTTCTGCNVLRGYPIYVRDRASITPTLTSLGTTKIGTLIVFLNGFNPRATRAALTGRFSNPIVFYTTTRRDNSDLLSNHNSTCYNVLGTSCGLGLHNIRTCVPRCPINATTSYTTVVQSFIPITATLLTLSSLGVVSFNPHPRSFLTYGTPVTPLRQLNVRVRRGDRLSLCTTFRTRTKSTHVPSIMTRVRRRLNRNGGGPRVLTGLTRCRLALLS